MLKRLWFPLSALFCFLVAMTATAFAAGEVTPDNGSLLDLAKPILAAAKDGQWWMAVSLALVLACTVARKYGAKKWPVLNSNAGATLLLFGMSYFGAIATGLAASGTNSLTGALAFAAFKIAVGAAGGYSILKTLGEWVISRKWYQEKAPAWFKAGMGVAMWAFSKSPAIAKAEAAGDKAVATTPAPGASPGEFEKF